MKPFANVCKSGALCDACMCHQWSSVHRSAWRKKYQGVPENGAACLIGKEWKKSIPITISAKKSMRGLGDVVAAVTKAVGIKQCRACKKRQEKLNKIVPFKSDTKL